MVGHAFSPLGLMPGLGYLDDLVLVPLGVALAVRMIPPDVLAEHRKKARAVAAEGKPASRLAAGVVVAARVLLAGLAIYLLSGMTR